MNQSDNLENPKFVTYFFTASLNRKNPNSFISSLDIQSYVGDGLWKAYDSLRREASNAIGINEINLGVSDAKVIGFKVDGHKVINPEGFAGKSVQIVLLITLARKDEVTSLKGLLELGSVKAFMAAESAGVKNAIYAETLESSTSIFAVLPQKSWRVSQVNWGLKDVIGRVGESLTSDNKSVSEIIYSRFLGGALSSGIISKITKSFTGSFQTFLNSVTSAILSVRSSIGNATPAILLNSQPLPQFVYSKHFSFADKRAKITNVGISESDAQNFIVSKSEAYRDLNEVVRLRTGWLINKS